MKNIFSFLKPPDEWRWAVNLLLGIFVGIGCLAFYISNAPSYLSDKPETCMNCHVMAPQFATWQRSSHARVTVCNDCHVPHDNFLRKYLFKAQDGLRHSSMFTFRMEPQVIQIKEAGIKVVQENCIRCHSSLVDNVSAHHVTGDNYKGGAGRLCWQCHRETPHGRVSSLASTPYARIPRLSSVVPKWMEKFLEVKK
jgi:cytochrome c nitrite reductase small subunit